MGKNKNKNRFWGGRDVSPEGDDMEEKRDKMKEKEEIPEGEYTIPLGVADVKIIFPFVQRM